MQAKAGRIRIPFATQRIRREKYREFAWIIAFWDGLSKARCLRRPRP